MLESILNLEGAQVLTTNEQKLVKAGGPPPPPGGGSGDCSGWTKPIYQCAPEEFCEIVQFPDGSIVGECI